MVHRLPALSTVVLAAVPLGYFFGGGKSEGLITASIYTAAWVLMLAKWKREGFRVVAADVLWVIWAVVMVAAPIWSPTRGETLLVQALQFLVVGVGTILFCRTFLKSRSDAVQALSLLLFLSTAFGVVVLVDYLLAGAPVGGRYVYQSVNPIPLSMLGATIVTIAFAFYIHDRLTTWIFAPLSFVGAGLMLISASRGPLIATALTVVLLLPIAIRKVGLAQSLLVAGVALAATRVEQAETVVTRLAALDGDLSVSHRLNFYREAYESWTSSPIIGGGVGEVYPHNMVLEVLATHGASLGVPLLITVAVVVGRYAMIVRLGNSDVAATASYGLVLLSLISLMFSWTYLVHKWLFLGIGLVLVLEATSLRVRRRVVRMTAKSLLPVTR
ncbi:MAG: O-antigen ligase family protein [Euzebya sp.]